MGGTGNGVDPVSGTVAELRFELDGLRESSRLRAVIEQAKGVLVGRDGITLDEAFARLKAISQQHNVRVVEVAASVVATAQPHRDGLGSVAELVVDEALPTSPRASGTWQAFRAGIEQDLARTVLDTVAGSTQQGDRAAGLLAELLAGDGVSIVSVYRIGAGGALHLVGQYGVAPDVAAAWSVIPPTPVVPLTRAVAQDRALFWGTRSDRERDFPAMVGVPVRFGASAAVPVHDVGGGPVIGVVGLGWGQEHVVADQARDRVARLVGAVGAMMLPDLEPRVPELEWLTSLQALHLDPWLILEAVPAASQPDSLRFRVRSASQDLPRSGTWTDRCLLELWPDLAGDGTWEHLGAVARDGVLWASTIGTTSSAPWGTPGTRLRALRAGRFLVLVWRPWRARRTVGDEAPDQVHVPTAALDTAAQRERTTAGGAGEHDALARLSPGPLVHPGDRRHRDAGRPESGSR